MPSLAQSERARLCETALAAGPDAPTLCGDWTVKDLAVHLVIREGDLLAAPGIAIKPLSFLTERASKNLGTKSLNQLVERVRTPPRLSPFRIPAVDKAANTLEYFVHHEDIRRAATTWQPRDLSDHEQNALWASIGTAGKGLVRPAGVPVEIVWADKHRTRTLRSGDEPVTVTGLPSEIALFLFGRQQNTGLEFTGPEDRVAKLREAELGM
jgi:uncharacterized protein (TIGR03085 family)